MNPALPQAALQDLTSTIFISYSSWKLIHLVAYAGSEKFPVGSENTRTSSRDPADSPSPAAAAAPAFALALALLLEALLLVALLLVGAAVLLAIPGWQVRRQQGGQQGNGWPLIGVKCGLDTQRLCRLRLKKRLLHDTLKIGHTSPHRVEAVGTALETGLQYAVVRQLAFPLFPTIGKAKSRLRPGFWEDSVLLKHS